MARALPFAQHWLRCSRCDLCKDRRNVVLGVGNPHADIMIIGKHPGPDENQIGSPFIGASGDMLDDLLEMVRRPGWSRDALFIDNIVACWPTQQDADGKKSTRNPSSTEIKACKDRISETIYRVDPLAVVAMGAVALKGLTGVETSMKSSHGGLYMTTVDGFYKKVTYPVFVTHHPAWLVRNPSEDNKKMVRDDLRAFDRYVQRLKRIYSTAREG